MKEMNYIKYDKFSVTLLLDIDNYHINRFRQSRKNFKFFSLFQDRGLYENT